MKKLQNKKGFTLIELLVVITIIGILATGWISVFTKQLQGARDTTRIWNLKLLETASNQYFSDNSEYPNEAPNTANSGSFRTQVSWYMSKFPEDPKTGQTICWTPDASVATWDCGVWYAVNADDNWLRNASFKLALAFEKQENASWANSPAAKDGWIADLVGYLEVFGWVGGSDLMTVTTNAIVTAPTEPNTVKLY